MVTKMIFGYLKLKGFKYNNENWKNLFLNQFGFFCKPLHHDFFDFRFY